MKITPRRHPVQKLSKKSKRSQNELIFTVFYNFNIFIGQMAEDSQLNNMDSFNTFFWNIKKMSVKNIGQYYR